MRHRHQRALQTAARTFLNVMKSNDHSQEKYIDFLKDVKDSIQDHVSELKSCNVTEITKTVLKAFRDPLCKFLCPNELSTDSSDDDLPGHILNVEEDDIFHEFPPGTLTDEERQTISSCLELMEQSHTEAMAAIQCAKKLAHIMPSGPFRLLLQSMIHPIITIKGQQDRCIEHGEPSPRKPAFSDIVPDSEKAHDLSILVHILATVVAYSVKIKFGIKVSITSKAASYQVPEKKFQTCVKGMKYDSGSQKARQSGVITPKLSKHSKKQTKE